MQYTLIFDIGKTNEKCLLLDEHYQVVWKTYAQFEELKDEDGFPCDDLAGIIQWVKETVHELLNKDNYDIQYLNFSTYGASLVHIDEKKQPLFPLYNYLKPYPMDILSDFHKKYGLEMDFAAATASPPSGMLNSGMQLYWLKKTKSERFARVAHSLHFPQYLSYFFTGVPQSDFTSIGCHTSLWDYSKRAYHEWVQAENLQKKLPPLVPSTTRITTSIEGKNVAVGAGIHDSSAALVPYLQRTKVPFLLLSTGTWSVALNPFSDQLLSKEDLANDCLNYLQINGRPVRASRLFLGNEYQKQVEKLADHYRVDSSIFQKVKFDIAIFQKVKQLSATCFTFNSIKKNRQQPTATRFDQLDNFQIAYHQLMWELVELQMESLQRAIGNTPIEKIFIDGGFVDNDCFVELLKQHFPQYSLEIMPTPLGSALGAAMVVNGDVDFL
ncbi:MAG: FGGY family carbohydrate kinase [Bacteroidota bacterium]